MRHIRVLLLIFASLIPAALLAPPAHADVDAITVSQRDVIFGFVQVGLSSSTHTLTTTNNDNVPHAIDAVNLSGPQKTDFNVVSNACTGTTLAPGGTCDIGLRFVPTAAGTRVAHLSILAPPNCTLWVTLAGSGTPAPVARAAACTVIKTVTLPGTDTTTTRTVTQATPGSSSSTSNSSNSSRRCTSRRKLTIRLRPPKGARLRKVTATLAGKTIKVYRKGGRLRADLSLTGQRNGRYTFIAKYVTSTGKKATETRHYSTCVTPRR